MLYVIAVQTIGNLSANGKVQWVTSNQAEARRFQLEAERLVRFRGLSKAVNTPAASCLYME